MRRFVWLGLWGFSFSLLSVASELSSSNDILKAVEKAEEMAEKYTPSRVLFASDLDNTLLKTKQDLASEPWFNWQMGLLEDKQSEERIACNMDDLLNLYYVSISLSQSVPVQPNQAELIARLQEKKIHTMALTARGRGLASSTFRELDTNNIDFAKTSPRKDGYSRSHIPWKLKDFEYFGITEEEAKKWKLAEGKPVLYQGGVLFADGQHKGALLRTLIHKVKFEIKGIVFWDNDEKNTKRVLEAFEGTGIEVAAIRASRQDAEIAAFQTSDKRKVTEDYLRLRSLLDKTYGYPRPCVLPIDKKIAALPAGE